MQKKANNKKTTLASCLMFYRSQKLFPVRSKISDMHNRIPINPKTRIRVKKNVIILCNRDRLRFNYRFIVDLKQYIIHARRVIIHHFISRMMINIKQ